MSAPCQGLSAFKQHTDFSGIPLGNTDKSIEEAGHRTKVEKESEWERQKIEYPKIELLIIYISYSPLRRPKMTISKPKGIQGCPIFHFGRWSPAIAIWCPSQRRLRCCCRSSAESGRAATMHLGWTCRCVWKPGKTHHFKALWTETEWTWYTETDKLSVWGTLFRAVACVGNGWQSWEIQISQLSTSPFVPSGPFRPQLLFLCRGVLPSAWRWGPHDYFLWADILNIFEQRQLPFFLLETFS